jgi:4-methylaminobutanoate oxidase (formaldehyde-forming)
MLNERGGIESDVTVARHDTTRFMVMSSISHTRRDADHLRAQVAKGEDVRLRDATPSYAVLSIAGPKSRDLLAEVCDIDLSDTAFPANSLQQFYIGHAPVFAQRLSYTGELGWEIFITPDFAEHVFDVLWAAGQPMGLRMVGGEALNALRIEKGFLHWGHDMSYTEAPHQVGLSFACKPEKAIPFIGRDAFVSRRSKGQGPFLCHVKLLDPGALLYHNEPILRNGAVIGYVASGAFAYVQGAAIGICFINTNNRASIEVGAYEVIVEGQRIQASLSLRPFLT